jgi:hypothetical protein
MSDIGQDLLQLKRDDASFDDISIVKNEWDGRQIDWLLQWFVKFANQTSTTTGVTLTVGGAQISGDLISHQSYFEQLADIYSRAFLKLDGVDVDQVKQLILSFKPAPDAPDDKASPPCQYLHLSNVTVLSGSQQLAIQNGLWRGKITAVDGFILGR